MAYWVVPEGIVGEYLSIGLQLLTGRKTAAVYHVVWYGIGIPGPGKPTGTKNAPVYGPYPTREQAQSVADSLNGVAHAGVAAGAKAAGGTVSNPLDAVGNFFQTLTEKSTWERVALVGVGAGLLFVGIKAIAAPSGARSPVTQSAKRAGGTSARIGASAVKLTPPGRAAAKAGQSVRRAANRPLTTVPRKAAKTK